MLKSSDLTAVLDLEKLKSDANSEATKGELKINVGLAIQHEIDATPTMIIGSHVYKGSMLYEDLVKILSDEGAKLKICY